MCVCVWASAYFNLLLLYMLKLGQYEGREYILCVERARAHTEYILLKLKYFISNIYIDKS